MKKYTFFSLLVFSIVFAKAQGTWTQVTSTAPNVSGGFMVLLSDGTVLCKSSDGGGDGIGNIWNKLTPDTNGSYINGKWTSITPMHDTRLYFSTQVLRDGRVYVAGGEYGTGGATGEVYNPVTDTWSVTPFPGPSVGDAVLDANSKMLPDGRILQSVVSVQGGIYSDTCLLYDPASNAYSIGPTCLNSFDESSWLMLPDNSILFNDFTAQTSERYIPSMNQWVADATLPVAIYDNFDSEMGAGVLLPNGKAIFFGSNGNTAIYTPSGTSSPGSWIAGTPIPGGNGTTDAPAAMMVNGKILMCGSPVPATNGSYPSPTSFYEYDYLTDSYAPLNVPGGGTTLNTPVYTTNLLDLPDGTVMFCEQGATQYYVYTPTGSPLAAGKPTISNIIYKACNTFAVAGTLFNGISEGAAYGDDFQQSSNYPIVRLTSGPYVYYARTFNWNRIAVQTGGLPDTTQFTVPAGLLPGTYSLQVVANGIASSPVTFTYSPTLTVTVVSNPASDTICSGNNAVLTAAGGVTYLWCNSAITTTVSVSPTVNTTYTVTGSNVNHCQNTATITINVKTCTTGIDQVIGNTNQVAVFPNPFDNEINIQLQNTGEEPRITLMDMLGNEIKTEVVKSGNTILRLHATSISPGIYMLKVNRSYLKVVKE